MVLELILFPFVAIIFLFTLYVLSREDFIFLRKNVTLYEIFDVAFLLVAFIFFFARLFYVLFNFRMSFLNPFVFFLVPYFPGLSLTGGVVGAIVTLMVITKRKKYPRGRFFDFFALAFLAILPVLSLGAVIRGSGEARLLLCLPIFYYGLLLLFFLKILLPRFLQGQMRDGMLGLLILMNYSLFSTIMVILLALNQKHSPFIPELGVLICLFVLSLFFYFRQSFPLTIRRG